MCIEFIKGLMRKAQWHTSKEMTLNIEQARNSVCGLLRVHHISGNKYNIAIIGTAWCAVPNHYFVTAYHVLNNGKARNQNDKFFILRAPDNGPKLERTPVVAFTLEDQKCDYVVLEINEQEGTTLGFDALPIYTGQVKDGTQVLTYGYPAPQVSNVKLNRQGQLTGIKTVLLSHANEGIVASQYAQGQYHMYELNVGWHHGESGGPILILNPPRVIAIMQSYKNISTPHGTVAGPHLGTAIKVISSHIANLS